MFLGRFAIWLWGKTRKCFFFQNTLNSVPEEIPRPPPSEETRRLFIQPTLQRDPAKCIHPPTRARKCNWPAARIGQTPSCQTGASQSKMPKNPRNRRPRVRRHALYHYEHIPFLRSLPGPRNLLHQSRNRRLCDRLHFLRITLGFATLPIV